MDAPAVAGCGDAGDAANGMKLKVLNVRDVAETQLCCGCGACAYVSPDEVEMIDVADYGRRPRLLADPPEDPRSAEAMRVCPGVGLRRVPDEGPGLVDELLAGWGPVRALWEGFATDPEIRFAGSSGGAASALALFCIERAGMHGLLHITSRDDVPYLNKTVLSRSRAEILAATGSRYAPASPCDGLGMIEDAPSRCVMIGKPCDIAAAENARRIRPGLDSKLGLTIAVFCAGTPSTKGTLEMLKAMGVLDPKAVRSLRYRGNGWPGRATVVFETPKGEESRDLSYEDSWGGVLQKYRQWRCYLCADHTGEFADISVGDPWYRPVPPGAKGHSLVVARTPRGLQAVKDAIAAGYLTLEPVASSVLPASQPGLLTVRGFVWARILTLRTLRVPTPRYHGIPMFRYWLTRATLKEKAQSIYGTVKRVFTKRLARRHEMIAMACPKQEVASGERQS
jgi:coenzyme F420 hydrogenase subunit beta